MSNTTIKIKGNNNTGKVKINQNEKEGFTAILTISVSGKKLKPIVVAKGKTKRSLIKYDLNNDKIIGAYSNNGWVNCGILKLALDEIYLNTKGKKSVLVLDKFPTHTDKFIGEYAKEKNIHLIFIPEGMTSVYQPLDVSINGILKQIGKKLWREHSIKNENIKITNKDAVSFFLEAFLSISRKNVRDAFFISCLKK
jgi:transposase